MSNFDLTNESFEIFLQKNKDIVIENITFLIVFLFDLEIFQQNNNLIYILKNFIELNFPNNFHSFNKVVYYIVNNYILNHKILETLLNYNIIDISKINISNYFNTNIEFKDPSYLQHNINLNIDLDFKKYILSKISSTNIIHNRFFTTIFSQKQYILLFQEQYKSLNVIFNKYKELKKSINIPKISTCLLLNGLKYSNNGSDYRSDLIFSEEFNLLLKLIKDNYGDWHPDTSYIAIKDNFSVEVLEYLFSKGCPIHPQSLQLAMQKEMYYHANIIIQKQDKILSPTNY